MMRRNVKAVGFALGALLAGSLLLCGCNGTTSPSQSGGTGESADSEGGRTEQNASGEPEGTSGEGSMQTAGDLTNNQTAPEEIVETLTEDISVKFTTYDQNLAWEEKVDGTITLNGDSIASQGAGISVDGTTVTIISKGTYEISGKLDDGQIIVDVPDADNVRLVMNGVEMSCSSSCPVYVMSGNKVVLLMAEGTVNTFTDSPAYTKVYEDGSLPNACIYSRVDMVINGSGTLKVNGNYNNGIGCKNDLKILGTTIEANGFKNGIKGNDSIVITDHAVITVDAGNDGVKSDQEGRLDKGFIYIKSGSLAVKAGDDALQAYNAMVILEGVSISYDCGGKEINCDGYMDVAESVLP